MADSPTPDPNPPNPESSAAFLSRCLLLWVAPLVRLGRERDLLPDDLWELPKRDDPARLHARFLERWRDAQASPAAGGRSRARRMFGVLWGLFGWRLFVSGVWVVLATGCQFVWPTYINALVQYAQAAAREQSPDAPGSGAADGDGGPGLWEGLSLAVEMLLWQLLGCVLAVQADFALTKLGVACRCTMLSAIYHHVLTLPPRTAAPAASRGRLLSLLTQDATKIEQGIMFTHRAWIAPVSVVFGLGYICTIIGPATFVGFGFMCVAIVPVNKIKNEQQRWQRAKMERTDARARLVEETFSAMKVIKYHGWEAAQLRNLEQARGHELTALRRFKMLEAFSGPVNGAPSLLRRIPLPASSL